MTADHGFWDRIAEKYAARPVGDAEAYEATLERVRHWLGPESVVHEIGCGTGSTALRLWEGVARYEGSDFSPEMIRIATGKLAGQERLRFLTADAGERIAPDVDAVLAFNLLHLVGDRKALLRRIHGTLPKGGLFISKTPCLGGKPWFRPLVALMQWVGKAPRPVHILKPAGLEQEIVAAGFEILETGGYPKSLPNHLVVARSR